MRRRQPRRKCKVTVSPRTPTPEPPASLEPPSPESSPSPSPEPEPIVESTASPERDIESTPTASPVSKKIQNQNDWFSPVLDTIKENAEKAVEALTKYTANKKSESLFKDLPTRFILNITCFKTPTLDQSFFNIALRNSIHPTGADVVLIIKHDKRRMKNQEDYIEPEMKASLYKDKLLNEYDLKLKEVITLSQLRDDYSTFEGKRKFMQRIDVLLVDKTIVKHMPQILGREMYKRKKYPIAVSLLEARNVQEEIQKALKKTVLQISSNGKTSSVIFGNDELSKDQLVENIGKICRSLKKKFPGGWSNIDKLSITALNVPPLIIYFSKGGPEDVTKPVKRSRKYEGDVEGEISTQLNQRIKIGRFGKITTTKVDEDDE